MPSGVDEDSLVSLLSRFLDMVNRSVLECSCDIHVDITENELKTLQELTQQVCEQFKRECTAKRAELATFAKLQYGTKGIRQTASRSSEDVQQSEMELAR